MAHDSPDDNHDCPFCNISEEKDITNDADKILWKNENESILLIPTVGPIVDGHVMLIPRKHGYGSLSEPPKIRRGLHAALQKFLEICNDRGEGALYCEHGEGADTGRPCISHTHVHILPGLSHLVEQLSDLLPPYSSLPCSYMIYGRIGSELVRDATNTRSQYLRKVIGEALGVDTWDYAAFPNLASVDRTIRYWNALLQ